MEDLSSNVSGIAQSSGNQSSNKLDKDEFYKNDFKFATIINGKCYNANNNFFSDSKKSIMVPGLKILL